MLEKLQKEGITSEITRSRIIQLSLECESPKVSIAQSSQLFLLNADCDWASHGARTAISLRQPAAGIGLTFSTRLVGQKIER